MILVGVLVTEDPRGLGGRLLERWGGRSVVEVVVFSDGLWRTVVVASCLVRGGASVEELVSFYEVVVGGGRMLRGRHGVCTFPRRILA